MKGDLLLFILTLLIFICVIALSKWFEETYFRRVNTDDNVEEIPVRRAIREFPDGREIEVKYVQLL